MRGTIIMWTGEKGAVSASGQQYKFEIEQWRGDIAPRPDMTVEITVVNGSLASLSPVQSSEVAKEKLSQFSDQGTKLAQNIYSTAGKNLVVAYAIFALSALFLTFLSVQGAFGLATGSVAMPGILSGVGNSGDAMGVLLILISLASIAVPYFWKDKLAPLSYCLPMLITLYADYKVEQVFSSIHTVHRQATTMFGDIANPFDSLIKINIGIGAYATFIVAAYIAYCGIREYLRNQTH